MVLHCNYVISHPRRDFLEHKSQTTFFTYFEALQSIASFKTSSPSSSDREEQSLVFLCDFFFSPVPVFHILGVLSLQDRSTMAERRAKKEKAGSHFLFSLDTNPYFAHAEGFDAGVVWAKSFCCVFKANRRQLFGIAQGKPLGLQ